MLPLAPPSIYCYYYC